MSTAEVPGPRVLPGIGTAYAVNPNNLVQSAIDLGNKFGEIYRHVLPGQDPLYVVSSHRLVDELCDQKRFHKALHPSLTAIRTFAGNGLFTSEHDDPEWARAHRILMPAFNPLALEAMFNDMTDIADQLMLKWSRTRDDEPVDIPGDCTRLTLDTIALCSFSFRFNSFYKEELHPFVNAMVNGLKDSGSRSHMPDLINTLNVKGTRRFQRDCRTMEETVDALIAERKENPSPQGEEDVLDVMLNATDPETGEKLSDENLRYQLITFLIAGHETTSGLLSFVVYELIKNPRVFEKARGIVDEVLDGRFPEFSDLKKLGYLDQILREGLRLYPTAPAFAVSPYESTVLGGDADHPGVKVNPKDTLLVILGRMHRDPAVWDNPEEFRPERFDYDNAKKIPQHAWKPFGNGQRSCLGRAFAIQEATMVLALMLQHFDFEFHDPQYELEMIDGLTTKPKDLFVNVKNRPGRTYRGRNREQTHDASITGMDAADDVEAAEANGHAVQILVGSNAGTCRNFAKKLQNFATSQGYETQLLDLDAAVDNLQTEDPVLIVTSSYEGLPPDNAAQFVDWLETAPSLQNVNYAVFGCGNSEWASTFQRVPTLIDERLSELGANRLIERGQADVRSDYVGAFEQWAEKLWQSVSEFLGTDHDAALLTEAVTVELADAGRTEFLRAGDGPESKGFVTGIVSRSRALSPAEDNGPIRVKHHLDIRLPEDVHYTTGDYLEVLPRNPQDVIDRVVLRFGLDVDTRVVLGGNTSFLPVDEPIAVGELLGGYVELGEPASRKDVEEMAKNCLCPPERAQLEAFLAPDTYQTEVQDKRRSPLCLLEEFPSVQIEFADFLNMLVPLRPRRYSISSSALSDERLASITFSQICEDSWSGRGQYVGTASSYLTSLAVGSPVSVRVVPGKEHFRPEKDLQRPMILVGAGTGIAPLRAFVEDTAIRVQTSGARPARSLLFYGCHGPDSDFLYHKDLEQWSNDGVVDVRPAFSRHAENGVSYVQHRLWQDRTEVAELLKNGARLLVCGDAARLAPAVRATITEILAEDRGLDGEAAAELVENMEHRDFSYVSDIFD